MAMKVTFDLTDNDLKYFRRVMKEVRAKHKNSSEQEILDACRALIEGISATRAPDFVRSRVEKLSVLIEMLEDTEWRIGGRDRERVGQAPGRDEREAHGRRDAREHAPTAHTQ